MQFIFEARDAKASDLRAVADQRVRFVMRRALSLLSRAKVQLSDANGPRGGVDKRCRLELTPERGASIVVVTTATDWRSALDRALDRGSRTLVRGWQRRRSVVRIPMARELALSESASWQLDPDLSFNQTS